jgi:serine/threonine-protein kinase
MAAPTTIGDYVIERELGEGAFGVVYRAHHRSRPEVPVAVKVVKGKGNTDRMLLEPAVLSQLDHPCIVGMEDYFLRGDDLVLALEYIDGKDLKELFDRGERFSESDVRDLLVQIGAALASAHSRNVLHRDIKPANILVTRLPEGNYRFVLTDFGIGQVREGIQSEKQAGGTYLFMAPEQLRGRPGPQSDLWALGVVAYRMITGKLPFPGPTVGELKNQVLYQQPPLPSDARGEPIDGDLESAILGLLDKSLSERTASAEELLRQLGHTGPPDSVLKMRGHRQAAPKAGLSLDQSIQSGITMRWVLIALFLVLYLAPQGTIAGALMVAGLALFYFGQRSGKWLSPEPLLLTLFAYVVLAGAFFMRYIIPMFDVGLTMFVGPVGGYFQAMEVYLKAQVGSPVAAIAVITVGILVIVLFILWLFLPVFAGGLFAGLRRLQREKALRDLAREGQVGSDRYLEALREAVDERFEDVGLHLKYAEALYARGRIIDAATECRLLLRQDPYNFAGCLLLANAYLALGLKRECVELCDWYLDVSGYCFEFAELREQSTRRAA